MIVINMYQLKIKEKIAIQGTTNFKRMSIQMGYSPLKRGDYSS